MATAAAKSNGSFVARLAQFFPQATAVRIPVSVIRLQPESGQESEEKTVIEFGTERELIFHSRQPLEFADRVRIKNADGSLDAEASVVAVQFGDGGIAVAVRFTDHVANWIIQAGL